MSSPLHFLDQFRNGEWIRFAPVSCRVGHDPVGADHLDDVAGSGGSALRGWIERHTAPEAIIECQFDGVLLNVIDANPMRFDPGIVLEHIDNHPCALVLILKVWSED